MKYTILILLILIIFIIVAGALYWWNKNTAPLSFPEEQTLPEIPADWKTYRNEEYGFEFSGPKDWILERVGGYNLADFDFYLPIKKDFETEEEYYRALMERKHISVVINETQYTDIQEWFNNEFRERDPALIPDRSRIKLGDVDGLSIFDPISYSGCEASYYVFIKNPTIYKIYLWCTEEGGLIFSTFRFLE